MRPLRFSPVVWAGFDEAVGHGCATCYAARWAQRGAAMVDEQLTDSTRLCPHPYFRGMPPRRRTSKDTPAKLAGRMKRRCAFCSFAKPGRCSGRGRPPTPMRPKQWRRSSSSWTSSSAGGSWCRRWRGDRPHHPPRPRALRGDRARHRADGHELNVRARNFVLEMTKNPTPLGFSSFPCDVRHRAPAAV